mgnify:CR=1 FL=1
MIGWTLQWTIISLILIMLIHYLYSFFINTLTVPKVRDLINKPTERYNEILSSEPNKTSETPNVDTNEMQAELRDFLSNIKKGTNNAQDQIMSANEAGGYSTY